MGVRQVSGLKQKEHLYPITTKERVNKEELNKLLLRPGVGARVMGKRPTLVMENLRILSFNTQDNSAFSIQKILFFFRLKIEL